jgi:TolB-like protein/tetratricopeptide (TPR) repeat protein
MQEPANDGSAAEECRLDSWKEIAAYLKRDVTTVQRWEKREGMPVYRHLHDKRGSVYAVQGELDAWLGRRRPRPEEQPTDITPTLTALEAKPDQRKGLRPWVLLAFAVVVLVAGTFVWHQRTQRHVAPPIRSLAVLPLRNLSGDKSQDYLADGITAAMIGRLAGIRDLRVKSLTSVIRFKDTKQSVSEIARSLGVDAVVEGSVIREGSRLRVSAQLIRASSDDNLWSETYDREMRDVLTMESELAQRITEKVRVTVTGDEQQRLTASRPVAPEVYESYLKGRYAESDGNTREALDRSIGHFQDAIAQDETFAPAYVGLAIAYTNLGTVFAGIPPAETRPKVIAAARKALQYDPNLGEAHTMLANMLQQQWQWTEAEKEYRRAFDLSPNDALTYADFALWLSDQGRADEAVDWVRRGRELDPVTVSGSQVSWILFQAHRFDEALREARGDVAVHPDSASSLTGLGFALLGEDNAQEAIGVLEKADALAKGSPAVEGLLIRAYAHAGRRGDALRILETLKSKRKKQFIPAGAFLNAYLGLDDREQALAWMEQAFREQSTILQFVKTHPFFDPVRSDPRFTEIANRVLAH